MITTLTKQIATQFSKHVNNTLLNKFYHQYFE